jgi:hypothetical protein
MLPTCGGAFLILGLAVSAQAGLSDVRTEIRMLAVAGQLGGDQDSAIFEVDITDASTTFVMQMTNGPDTNSLGWNPIDGNLYYTSGSDSWTDDPFREAGGVGYRDNQYMSKVDLRPETPAEVPIFNANPSPPDAPPNDYFLTFHLPAPIPTWTYPYGLPPEQGGGVRRGFGQEGSQWGDPPMGRGPNEYHGIRGHTWNRAAKNWYASDEFGLFTMSTTEPTLIGQPVDDPNFAENEARNLKGISIYHPGPGQTKLLAGMKREKWLWEVDPNTGAVSNPVAITIVDENGTFVADSTGLVGLAQHPVTGELYGVHRDAGDESGRDLLLIDPVTGQAQIIGEISTDGEDEGIAAIAFTGWMMGDLDRDGDTDFDDIDDFVLGLNNPAAYEAARGIPGRVNGDQDEDWDLDFDDIGGFVGLLGGAGASASSAVVPEPSSAALAILGLLGATAAWYRRRRC